MSHPHAAAKPHEGQFTCQICARVHDQPRAGDPPVICPCGWWYHLDNGRLVGAFRNPF
ncbi:MAG: hypothetical protein KGM44_04250 [bacterium]|nr:hypothetical protein [bacterium]